MRLTACVSSICLFVVCAATCSAQDLADGAEIKLWPNGLPLGARTFSAEEIAKFKAKNSEQRIAWVEEPTLTIYRPEKPNGCGVVVLPGGGYNILAYVHEGVEIADWFNSIGVTAVMAKYRVPRRDKVDVHVEPLQDAQRAIRWMRHNAESLGVDPNRVGVLGFSAGGHLTCMTGMHWDKAAYEARDDVDEHSCRPDFMCPIYAAYLADGYTDNVAELGPLVRVTKETPPTFLSVSADDKMRGAQSALLFVELKKADVPAELHVFAKGGHGYGLRGKHPSAQWPNALAHWLGELRMLEAK